MSIVELMNEARKITTEFKDSGKLSRYICDYPNYSIKELSKMYSIPADVVTLVYRMCCMKDNHPELAEMHMKEDLSKVSIMNMDTSKKNEVAKYYSRNGLRKTVIKYNCNQTKVYSILDSSDLKIRRTKTTKELLRDIG